MESPTFPFSSTISRHNVLARCFRYSIRFSKACRKKSYIFGNRALITSVTAKSRPIWRLAWVDEYDSSSSNNGAVKLKLLSRFVFDDIDYAIVFTSVIALACLRLRRNWIVWYLLYRANSVVAKGNIETSVP